MQQRKGEKEHEVKKKKGKGKRTVQILMHRMERVSKAGGLRPALQCMSSTTFHLVKGEVCGGGSPGYHVLFCELPRPGCILTLRESRPSTPP